MVQWGDLPENLRLVVTARGSTMRSARKRLWLLILLLLIAGGVSATDIIQQEICTIPAERVVEGNLYVLCRQLMIEGVVQGNVIGLAYLAEIHGRVDKNIYLAGGELDIHGTVGDDIHFGGLALNIESSSDLLDSDVFLLGLSGSIRAATQVTGQIVALGYQLAVDGNVTEGIEFWGSALKIAGEVAGNVDASVGDATSQNVASQLETFLLPLQLNIELIDPGLRVEEPASIGGVLTYRAPSQGEILAEMETPPVFIPNITNSAFLELMEQQDTQRAVGIYINQVIREFTTLGLLGLVSLVLIPGFVKRPIRAVRRQPISSFGVGLLSFILSFPIVLVVLILSLLVILILALLRLDGVIVAGGIILGIVNIGGTSLFYFIAIFISRMIMAVALGRLLVSGFMPLNTTRSWYISLGIGVFILALLASLPQVGWIVNALAIFFGLGAILTVIQAEFRTMGDESQRPAPVYYPTGTASTTASVLTAATPAATTVRMPVPLLEERASNPGMDNLPPGFDFDWFVSD